MRPLYLTCAEVDEMYPPATGEWSTMVADDDHGYADRPTHQQVMKDTKFFVAFHDGHLFLGCHRVDLSPLVKNSMKYDPDDGWDVID